MKKTVLTSFTIICLLSTAFLVGSFFNILSVRGSRTVYIRTDGSIEPSTANIASLDNVTYYFTDDIYDQIVVERSNITVDGNGYTVQGSGMQQTSSGNGFFIYRRSNVTIKNTNIRGFRAGIQLDDSLNNNISGNNIRCNYIGISLKSSDYNNISENSVTHNAGGIQLYKSSSNHVSGNSVTANECGGIYLKDYCDYNSIFGNNISENTYHGIELDYSNSNSIFGNNITNNKREGILLTDDSEYNSIYENNITNNGDEGINLCLRSANNIILRNNITNNICGIRASTRQNIISGNTVKGNSDIGIDLGKYSTIVGNNITNNSVGIVVGSDNSVYHNNLINNTEQVRGYWWDDPETEPSANTWDDGYPSGGNYWSDYEERYPYAVELDSAGIWDTPYVICENNTDRYPLMNLYADTTHPTISILSPENMSYSLDDVPLTFTVSETTLWIGYSLDDQENQTITGNWTLSDLSEGPHSMIVYAQDNVGNTGASEMVCFTIETTQLFPIEIVAVIVIIGVVVAIALVYFTKLRK